MVVSAAPLVVVCSDKICCCPFKTPQSRQSAAMQLLFYVGLLCSFPV